MERANVLVTGFEAFGGLASNPARDLLGMLPGSVAGATVHAMGVPVVYDAAVETVCARIDALRPIAVVMLGQARGRTAVTVERVAVNVDDAGAPDNAGEIRRDAVIRREGPAAYFSTLPVRAMVAAMHAVGVPAAISDTAGSYVCNHLMYGVLDHCARMGLATRAGFVHVPLSCEQVVAGDLHDEPSLPLASMARAVAASLEALVETTG